MCLFPNPTIGWAGIAEKREILAPNFLLAVEEGNKIDPKRFKNIFWYENSVEVEREDSNVDESALHLYVCIFDTKRREMKSMLNDTECKENFPMVV